MIVLVGSQNIRQFPVKLLASRTLQSANPEPDLFASVQTVMALAGIPVDQFSPTVRAYRCLPARE